MPPTTSPYTIDVALLSTHPTRKMHLRDVFHSEIMNFTPTKPYLSDESFYQELSVEMGKRNRSSGNIFVNNASQYAEILDILKTRSYNGFTLSHDQRRLLVFRRNDKNCHLKKSLLASQVFDHLFELFTAHKLDFMHHPPEQVYRKLMQSDRIDHAIDKAWVQSFSTAANSTLAQYSTPLPRCNYPYHPFAIMNDCMPPSNPYTTPPVIMSASMPPFRSPPMMMSGYGGFMPGEWDYLMEQNRLQQIQIMNVIKDRDETVDKLTLEAASLRQAALDRAELDHNKDMQSFAAQQNKQQQAEIMNIMTQRDAKNEQLTAQVCTLRKTIIGHTSKEQHQSKEIEGLLAKQQLLEKEKKDLMEQNKRHDETIAACDHKLQQQGKKLESLLAAKHILEKEKDDLVKLDTNWKDEMTTLVKRHDEAQTSSNRQIASLRATIADYKLKLQRQGKELESLLAAKHILEKEKEDLVKLDTQRKDEMTILVEQHEEAQTNSNGQIASLRTTIADYELKLQQQKKHYKALKDPHEQHGEESSASKPEAASDSRPPTRRAIHRDGPIEIVVGGAGTPEVNDGFHPGTTEDIDFYFAPVTKACRHRPPLKGWVQDDEGGGPPPKLSYHKSEESSREPGNGSLRASQPFVSPARTEALEAPNQESSKHREVSEKTWTKRNALLIEENNKRHRADLDELIQQHEEKEKNSKAEIDALRTTIAANERKEIAQLKARIEVLRGKAGHYEQKEKKAKRALQEMVALEEKLTRKGLEARIENDHSLAHETPPSRNAKRARRDGGQDGEAESPVCDHDG